MKTRRFLRHLVVLGLGLGGCVSRPIVPVEAPPASFDPAVIAKGAQLAAIGNCMGCHIIQSMSWTLYESVAFGDTRIASMDWSTYWRLSRITAAFPAVSAF